MEGQNVNTETTWHLTPIATEDPKNFFQDFPGKNSPFTAAEAIVIALVLGSIIVGTVIGNILVCVAVCLVRKLRRPYNYLIVSLAVSDLCVALLVMPMALVYEILGSWSFGPIICDLWVSFDVLSCTASILNLCMISVDRYYAITQPLDYVVKRTPRRMIFCVGMVWLVAACISLPPLLILGNEHKFEMGAWHCDVCQNFGYQIYATLGSFYIPLIVMIQVYSKIFCAARKIVLEEMSAQSHLKAHCTLGIEPPVHDSSIINRPFNSDIQTTHSTPNIKQHRSSSASTTCSGHGVKCFTGGPRKSNESQCPMLFKTEKTTVGSSTTLTTGKSVVKNHLHSSCSVSNSPHQKKLRFQLAKERKASTTLGIIMSAFTICWLPFFVLALVRPFLSDPKAIPKSLSSLFLWLGYCNSLLNPIIYATLNRDFRKPFVEILCFRCGNLNHMMREEFYQSQYGDPVNNYVIKSCDHEDSEHLDNHGGELVTLTVTPANESFL
ncbi:5-hydroxytryptamine receptor 1-like [Chelonus insularis]|uniref:5-hydroxytryptamine receptor 1-like n=1 Tax=Chelonus insularis TaxID=460826 RepID=UPI00158B1C67|nr:5-hydroxytryptamine receptor 1-like [Chelonus insularis]XP_034944221.1 5-hydroxytryptamine receptor 1-like [Chelonus insularis]XP_034944222.1 5-hydroxytryptamine receptor 1-like [Chelonus insularis]XP_034944223.1 5-hydroxytryptamine receptor 1-like [Chelonus insularis]